MIKTYTFNSLLIQNFDFSNSPNFSVYRELIDKKPSPESYLLLGDAYMSIQEPEKAIDVYESALKKNPQVNKSCKKMPLQHLNAGNAS